MRKIALNRIFDYLGAFLTQQAENALVWVALCLGVGACAYFGLHAEPSFSLTGGLLAASLCFLWGMSRRRRRQSETVPIYSVWLISCACVLVMCGFMAAQIETYYQGTPMIAEDTLPLMVMGTLNHIEPQEGNKGKLIVLGNITIDGWQAEATPYKIRLTVRKALNAKLGDRVSVLAKLTPPSPPVLPDGYDFQRHYFFERIGALGFALSDVQVIDTGQKENIVLGEVRDRIAQKIRSAVPEREAGIVTALMTGERAAIYDEDWNALRVSGLAHIISISGLHVAMVAGPVFFLLRFFMALSPFMALHYPIKKIAAAGALGVACLYVGLVVPSVPTTRALLMTAFVLIAVMCDRSPISMRIVAVSAIIVLIFQPDSVWNVSFQMSFAAVAALVATAEATQGFFKERYHQANWLIRCGLWVLGALMTSSVATLATAPFALYHFGQVSTYSVIANFISIPLSGLIIMPMLMVSFLLMPFGLEAHSLKLMGQGVAWLLDVARATELLPYAQLKTPTAPFSFLVLMCMAGIALLFLRGRVRYSAVVPLVIAFFCFLAAPKPLILVKDGGKVIAIYRGGALEVSSLKRAKFVTDTWRKSLGLDAENMREFPREAVRDGIICAGKLCRLEVAGQRITYGEGLYELHEDCNWAHIIITPVYTSKYFCGTKSDVVMIDHYRLKYSGAMALYDDGVGKPLRILTVGAQRGTRPWSITR